MTNTTTYRSVRSHRRENEPPPPLRRRALIAVVAAVMACGAVLLVNGLAFGGTRVPEKPTTPLLCDGPGINPVTGGSMTCTPAPAPSSSSSPTPTPTPTTTPSPSVSTTTVTAPPPPPQTVTTTITVTAPASTTSTSQPPTPPPSTSSAPPAPPPPSASVPAVTYQTYYFTGYGDRDNSCGSSGNGPGDCTAYAPWHARDDNPSNDGTFEDPIPVAVKKGALKFGTIVYSPLLQKYGIIADDCASCPHGVAPGGRHVDWWIDGITTSESAAEDCMNSFTGNHLLVVDAPAGLPVTPGVISTSAGCAQKFPEPTT